MPTKAELIEELKKAKEEVEYWKTSYAQYCDLRYNSAIIVNSHEKVGQALFGQHKKTRELRRACYGDDRIPDRLHRLAKGLDDLYEAQSRALPDHWPVEGAVEYLLEVTKCEDSGPAMYHKENSNWRLPKEDPARHNAIIQRSRE